MEQNNNAQSEVLKSIQDVSQLFDIPKPTIRYYEDMGLLHSVRDPSSNYRRYSLLSIVELLNILLYRNLDLSINEIRDIMEMPVEATRSALARASAEAEKEIEKLQNTIREIKQRMVRIEQYNQLRQFPMQLVDTISIEKIISWDQNDPASMEAYMCTPYTTPYIIYIPDLEQPDRILEGLATDEEHLHRECIWQLPSTPPRYMQCLLQTSYAYSNIIGLDRLLEGIRARGFTPISLIGEYLLSDVDPADKKKYDYFRAWIELE